MNRIATLLTASALVLAACGRGQAGPSASALDAQGAVPTVVPAGTTLRVADQLGALETVLAAAGQNRDFPYRIEYSSFVGGPPMLQAFQAGSVDIGFIATTPSIYAQAAHQNIVAVAGWASANGTDALVTAPGRSGITSWASLEGKTVAFQAGTVGESVLLEGLRSAQLELSDITPVELSTTAISAALESGSVDAAILVQPLTDAYLAKEPSAAQIAVGQALTDRSYFLIASTSAAADRPKEAAIADYITRLVKAYRWIDAHPQQWATEEYVDLYKLTPATAQKLVATVGPTTFFSLPGPIQGPQQHLADLYQQAGVIPASENVSAEFTSLFDPVVTRAQS